MMEHNDELFQLIIDWIFEILKEKIIDVEELNNGQLFLKIINILFIKDSIGVSDKRGDNFEHIEKFLNDKYNMNTNVLVDYIGFFDGNPTFDDIINLSLLIMGLAHRNGFNFNKLTLKHKMLLKSLLRIVINYFNNPEKKLEKNSFKNEIVNFFNPERSESNLTTLDTSGSINKDYIISGNELNVLDNDDENSLNIQSMASEAVSNRLMAPDSFKDNSSMSNVSISPSISMNTSYNNSRIMKHYRSSRSNSDNKHRSIPYSQKSSKLHFKRSLHPSIHSPSNFKKEFRMNERIRLLESQLNDVQEWYDHEQKERENCELNIQTLKVQQEKLKRENINLTDRLDSMLEEMKQIDINKAQQEREVKKIRNKLKEQERNLGDKQNKIDQMNMCNEVLQVEIESKTKLMDKKDLEIRNLKQFNRENSSHISELNEKLKNSELHNNELANHIADLQFSLREKNRESVMNDSSLMNEISIIEEGETVKSIFENDMVSKNMELDLLTKQNEILKENNETLDKELEELKEELLYFKEKVNELEDYKINNTNTTKPVDFTSNDELIRSIQKFLVNQKLDDSTKRAFYDRIGLIFELVPESKNRHESCQTQLRQLSEKLKETKKVLKYKDDKSNRELDKLTHNMEDKNEEIDMLKMKIEQLNKDIETFQNDIFQSQRVICQLNNDKVHLAKNITGKREKLKEMKKLKADYTEFVQKIVSLLNTLQQYDANINLTSFDKYIDLIDENKSFSNNNDDVCSTIGLSINKGTNTEATNIEEYKIKKTVRKELYRQLLKMQNQTKQTKSTPPNYLHEITEIDYKFCSPLPTNIDKNEFISSSPVVAKNIHTKPLKIDVAVSDINSIMSSMDDFSDNDSVVGSLFQEVDFNRLSALRKRNDMQRPHNRTSYPIETQTVRNDELIDSIGMGCSEGDNQDYDLSYHPTPRSIVPGSARSYSSGKNILSNYSCQLRSNIGKQDLNETVSRLQLKDPANYLAEEYIKSENPILPDLTGDDKEVFKVPFIPENKEISEIDENQSSIGSISKVSDYLAFEIDNSPRNSKPRLPGARKKCGPPKMHTFKSNFKREEKSIFKDKERPISKLEDKILSKSRTESISKVGEKRASKARDKSSISSLIQCPQSYRQSTSDRRSTISNIKSNLPNTIDEKTRLSNAFRSRRSVKEDRDNFEKELIRKRSYRINGNTRDQLWSKKGEGKMLNSPGRILSSRNLVSTMTLSQKSPCKNVLRSIENVPSKFGN